MAPLHSVPRKRSTTNASRSSKEGKYDHNRTCTKPNPTQTQSNRGRKRNENKKAVKSTGKRPVSLSSASSEGKSSATPKPKKAKPSAASTSSISIDSKETSSNDFARVCDLNKTLRSVQNKIRINLNSIKDKDELRLSIKDVHYQVKPKHQPKQEPQMIPTDASVVTESYIEQLRNEINYNRSQQPNKESTNIKELKSEISRYRKLIQCGGNVLDAMDFDERNVMTGLG